MKFKALLSITVAISFSFAADYVIKFSHVVSPNTPKGKAADFFAKRVEELSHGKIKVEVYPNAKLCSDKDVLSKIKLNAIQMAAPSFSKFTVFVPQLALFDLPFLFNNEDHLHKVLDGEVGQILLDLVNKKGYVALAYWDNGFKQLSNSKKALIKPEDAKGLKFRIMCSKVLIEQFRILNAVPIILPFSEVYSAIQQGIVDGQENAISNIYTKKIYKVQKYMTITNHGYLGYMVVISKKFWNKLPDNLKAIIKQAIKEATEKERIWAKEINDKQFAKIKEYAQKSGKLQIIYLTKEQRKAWVKKLRSIYSKFYGMIGEELIEKTIKAANEIAK